MSPVFREGSGGKRGREAARLREREKKLNVSSRSRGGHHPEGRCICVLLICVFVGTKVALLGKRRVSEAPPRWLGASPDSAQVSIVPQPRVG